MSFMEIDGIWPMFSESEITDKASRHFRQSLCLRTVRFECSTHFPLNDPEVLTHDAQRISEPEIVGLYPLLHSCP